MEGAIDASVERDIWDVVTLARALCREEAASILEPLSLGSSRLKQLTDVALEFSDPSWKISHERIRRTLATKRDPRYLDFLAFVRTYVPPSDAGDSMSAWRKVFEKVDELSGMDELTGRRLRALTTAWRELFIASVGLAMDLDVRYLSHLEDSSPESYAVLAVTVNWAYFRRLWDDVDRSFLADQVDNLVATAQRAYPTSAPVLVRPPTIF